MKAPKNRQSDDRNSHIASLVLVTPVWVSCAVVPWPAAGTPARSRWASSMRHQCSVLSSASGSVPGSRPQA